jgi:hypothetical protein
VLAPGQLALTAEAQARALVQQGVDWSEVLRLAHHHGVYPLLARNLEQLGLPGVPEEVRLQLRRACQGNAIRGRLFQCELVGIVERFGESRIPMVPLKGVSLADSLYGDVTRRVCSDIDVLVPRHAVTRAVTVLRAAGYRSEDKLWASAGEMELFLESDIEAVFHHRDRVIAPLVDLHWDITRRWRRDTKALDDLWAEASRTTLWGIETYRLSPEWEVLYLAVHAVRHRWQALKWLVDIHDYCSARVIDWGRLAAKADRFGWGRALRLTLGLGRALLGTAVPDALVLEPPRWALAQLHCSDSKWKNSWIPARVLDRWADRIGYVLRLLLRPTILERRVIRLPAALSLIYYLLRPLRLATRWAWPMATSTLKGLRL